MDPTVAQHPLTIISAQQTIVVPRSLQLSFLGGFGVPSWQSSDPSVARVDPSGFVSAKVPGEAVITIRRGLDSATLKLTVTAQRLDVEPENANIDLRATSMVKAVARDANGAILDGIRIVWNTTNAAVATVEANTGLVTGLTTGFTRIVASGGGVSGFVNLTVGTPEKLAWIAFNSIATVGNYACGIERGTDLAYCWGDNHSGALGSGDGDGSDTPTPVARGRRRFASVSLGYYSNCALEADTALTYCWGFNQFGEMGQVSDVRFSSISASDNVGCGVERDSGVVRCWDMGRNSTPSLFTPMIIGPVSPHIRFRTVSASHGSFCAIEDVSGIAYCWGANDVGQLGDGTATYGSMPREVSGGIRFSSISAGSTVTCGIAAETSRGYCWGSNSAGQLGDGTYANRLVPTAVGDSTLKFTSIDAGPTMVCGVEKQTGIAYCWGLNRAGSIGDGTLETRPLPAIVGGGTPRFSSISAGGAGGSYQACGVEVGTGRAYCWGHGQLIPTPVPSP